MSVSSPFIRRPIATSLLGVAVMNLDHDGAIQRADLVQQV